MGESMETVIIMGLGDKLGIVSFWCGIIAAIFTFIALITGFLGTQLSGKGVLDTIKATRETAQQASVRVEPQWGEYQKVIALQSLPPLQPLTALISYHLRASDTRIPLQVKFSGSGTGSPYSVHSGESGMARVYLTEAQTFYFCVGHPAVGCDIQIHGYQFDR